MYNRIAINIPSRGRSQTKLPKFLHSVCGTVSTPDHIYVRLVSHLKDPSTAKVATEILNSYGVQHEIILENLPYCHIATYFNMCYEKSRHNDESMVESMLGDDMVFITHNWDLRLLRAINDADGVGLFYCGGDERFDDALCVNAFLTRKFVSMCGCRFMCPRFAGNGIDIVWQTACDAVGLSYYLSDTVINHEQCTRANVGEDETYSRYRMYSKRSWRKNQMHEEPEARKIVKSLAKHGYPQVHPLERFPVCRGKAGRHIIVSGPTE
jgi:hypothetical protein